MFTGIHEQNRGIMKGQDGANGALVVHAVITQLAYLNSSIYRFFPPTVTYMTAVHRSWQSC